MTALEPQVVVSTAPVSGLAHQGYFVSSETGRRHGVTRDELPDTLAHLKGVSTIMVAYSNGLEFLSGRADHEFRIELWVRQHAGKITGHWDITTADDEQSLGIIQNLKNRIDVEIERQNAADWQAQPLDYPAVPPKASASSPRSSKKPVPPPTSSGSASSTSRETGFWHTMTTHPLPVTVVGSIVGGGVIFLIGLAIVRDNANTPSSPVTTTVTVTESSTVPATTESGAPPITETTNESNATTPVPPPAKPSQ
jgi:hypothetical protein